MSAEERLADVVIGTETEAEEEDDEEEMPSYLAWRRQQRRKARRKYAPVSRAKARSKP